MIWRWTVYKVWEYTNNFNALINDALIMKIWQWKRECKYDFSATFAIYTDCDIRWKLFPSFYALLCFNIT